MKFINEIHKAYEFIGGGNFFAHSFEKNQLIFFIKRYLFKYFLTLFELTISIFIVLWVISPFIISIFFLRYYILIWLFQNKLKLILIIIKPNMPIIHLINFILIFYRYSYWIIVIMIIILMSGSMSVITLYIVLEYKIKINLNLIYFYTRR